MNACMHGLTVVTACVSVCVYVVGWFGRLVCRVEQSTFIKDKEPLRIAISLQIVQAVEVLKKNMLMIVRCLSA